MKSRIGFGQALELTLARVPVMPVERVELAGLAGRVLAEDLTGRLDVPDADVSLKDGYAVFSGDLDSAGPDRPVRLRLIGRLVAGQRPDLEIQPGQAVRVTTGARLPAGAQSVVAEEFCQLDGGAVVCRADAEPGRNVLALGTDLRRGQVLARAGQRLEPAWLGLLAAAGWESAAVHALPKVALLATGDEIVAPGQPLPEGGLFASNLVEIGAWLKRLGLPVSGQVAGDQPERIAACIRSGLESNDALISSGGAWLSERDRLIEVLESLGWEGVYHRVRMGPGKGIGFGLLFGKPVFCLPGGPPSCEMALLQLALPGLMAMQASRLPLFASIQARLAEPVAGPADWTQFIHARLERRGAELLAGPARLPSRLRSMAEKQALIVVPEGVDRLDQGQLVTVQVVSPASWL